MGNKNKTNTENGRDAVDFNSSSNNTVAATVPEEVTVRQQTDEDTLEIRRKERRSALAKIFNDMLAGKKDGATITLDKDGNLVESEGSES